MSHRERYCDTPVQDIDLHDHHTLVLPAGFEPAIFAFVARRPSPLDDGSDLVGEEGFEPPIFCSQGRRLGQARLFPNGWPGRTRTSDQAVIIRRLYQLSYRPE